MGTSDTEVGDTSTDDGKWLDEDDAFFEEEMAISNHPMDARAMRHELGRLLDWYLQERERQSVNRFQMAIDHDYYDNLQWDPNDADEVKERGQLPISYNEVAPMCDWLIGTQRRTRIDWKVLPRTPDDVKMADVKTKVLKYLSDVNYVQFHRSRAFNDAVKGGLGWVEDGVRLDPTMEIIFSRYEDWRNVVWDSSSYELDLSDARYLFRWRWVDLDVALACFPDRAAALKRAAVSSAMFSEEDDDDIYFLGRVVNSLDGGSGFSRRSFVSDFANAQQRRARVKLIECQYRKPTAVQVALGGPFNRMIFNDQDQAMVQAREAGTIELEDHVMMRVHRAVFTEDAMIRAGVSPYRHNRFTLTPLWFYRRSRDRMPYGAIRRVRDLQDSINKRMSKLLWMLSTNQIITEIGATDDFDELAEEAARPDGVLAVRPGKRLEIQRDGGKIQGIIEVAQIDSKTIQRSGGVADENMGHETNAVSGEAIKARQLQGSVVTTEPFDNLRMATQWQGEKQLSLAEQFISEPKAIRLTEGGGPIKWLKINQPAQMPDGSVVFEDDITQSTADFVLSEQDFNGSLRQSMFEEMMKVAGGMQDPNLQIRMLILAYDYSDMPNKDEIVSELRRVANVPDPNQEPTPEQAEQMAAAQQQQQAVLKMQFDTAAAALDEQRAKAAKLNAEAEQIRAQAGLVGSNDGEVQKIMEESRQVQMKAAEQIDELSRKLTLATIDARNKVHEIGTRADTDVEVARINSDAQIRVAELGKEAASEMARYQAALDSLGEQFKALSKQLAEGAKAESEESKQAAKAVEKLGDDLRSEIKAVAETVKADAKQDRSEGGGDRQAAAPTSVNITLEHGAIQVDARKPEGSKVVTVKGPDGQTATATVEHKPDKGSAKE